MSDGVAKLKPPGAIRIRLVRRSPVQSLEPGLAVQQIHTTHTLVPLYLGLRLPTSFLEVPLACLHLASMRPLLRRCQHEVHGFANGLEYVDATDTSRACDVDGPFRKLIAAYHHVMQGWVRCGLDAFRGRERTRRIGVQESNVFDALRDIEEDTRLGDIMIVWEELPVETDWRRVT